MPKSRRAHLQHIWSADLADESLRSPEGFNALVEASAQMIDDTVKTSEVSSLLLTEQRVSPGTLPRYRRLDTLIRRIQRIV